MARYGGVCCIVTPWGAAATPVPFMPHNCWGYKRPEELAIWIVAQLQMHYRGVSAYLKTSFDLHMFTKTPQQHPVCRPPWTRVCTATSMTVNGPAAVIKGKAHAVDMAYWYKASRTFMQSSGT